MARLAWLLLYPVALGLLLASTFILYRNANAMSNLLEYPVWLVTGLLVPVSFLPGFVEPPAFVAVTRCCSNLHRSLQPSPRPSESLLSAGTEYAIHAGSVRRAYLKGLGEAKGCMPSRRAFHTRRTKYRRLRSRLRARPALAGHLDRGHHCGGPAHGGGGLSAPAR